MRKGAYFSLVSSSSRTTTEVANLNTVTWSASPDTDPICCTPFFTIWCTPSCAPSYNDRAGEAIRPTASSAVRPNLRTLISVVLPSQRLCNTDSNLAALSPGATHHGKWISRSPWLGLPSIASQHTWCPHPIAESGTAQLYKLRTYALVGSLPGSEHQVPCLHGFCSTTGNSLTASPGAALHASTLHWKLCGACRHRTQVHWNSSPTCTSLSKPWSRCWEEEWEQQPVLVDEQLHRIALVSTACCYEPSSNRNHWMSHTGYFCEFCTQGT